MGKNVQDNDRKYLYYALLILTGIVTLLPVGYNSIMDGGIVTEWVVRVEELASGLQEGKLYLFPSAEALMGVKAGIQEEGISWAGTVLEADIVNSSLWFLPFGILYKFRGNIVHVYDAAMLVLQVGTLFASVLMFQRIFSDRETRLPVFFGVLLYMTCPYRIYACYDLADISHAFAWMFFPLYVWAMAGVPGSERKWKAVLAASIALAGTGYADAALFLLVAGVTILAGVIRRCFWSLLPVAAGGLLFLPGLYRVVRFVFAGDFGETAVSVQAVMQDGYRLGEFFTTYSFRSGYPGMGLGMLTALLTGLWLAFVENKRESHKVCRIAVILSICFTVLSLYGFPWKLLGRMGSWVWRLLALTGGPAMFWGVACLCLCVPAACFMDRISRHENKLLAFVIPVMVVIACMGICVYQCNMPAYGREPLG